MFLPHEHPQAFHAFLVDFRIQGDDVAWDGEDWGNDAGQGEQAEGFFYLRTLVIGGDLLERNLFTYLVAHPSHGRAQQVGVSPFLVFAEVILVGKYDVLLIYSCIIVNV